jgi:ABC-type glycerol-3-phosphate transport system substrate-binding protein/DNA-binding transcriptional regulator YhcF (GntR family)
MRYIHGPMEIDPARPVPIYQQLKTLIGDGILERRYRPGDRLPTEHELCELHGISRTPVNRALSELASEGVILRHRRRGSFVNPLWLGRRRDDTEIRVVVPAYGPWEQLIRDAADGANLNIVRVPRSSLHGVLTHAVAEGQAPDLAVFDHVWAPEFGAAGFLHPLDELDPRWVRREHDVDFLASLADADRYGGQTFGVSAFAEMAGLWFSRRRLAALGLDPPTTWTELLSAARAVQATRPGAPLALPGGTAGGETTSYCLIGFLASNGANVLEDDGIGIGSAATAQTLRFLRRLVTEGCLPAAAVGYEWDRPVQLLADGQAALSVGGTYEAEVLGVRTGAGPRGVWDHFGFAPIPAGPNGQQASVAGAMIFAVFRQAAHPKAAMQLIERAVTPEALAAAARRSGRVPSRRSALALAGADLPFLWHAGEIIERAVTRPWLPLYSRVSTQLQAMLETVLTGSAGPVAAAQHTAAMIAAITGLPAAEPAPVAGRS